MHSIVKSKSTGRFVKVANTENIFFDIKTSTYYLIEQRDRKKVFATTKIKGEVKMRLGPKGEICYYAIKGLGAAKMAVKELRHKKNLIVVTKRPTFSYYSDMTLEIQKTKAYNTFLIARDGDKNLRPFFEKECPYLDEFEKRYEQIWARYIVYKSELKPGVKLDHDRRYLLMVLNRAHKQKAILTKFKKSDFPLNEVPEPAGRALSDFEVRMLLEAAIDSKNLKMYRQIKLAVYLGMRRSEIMHLRVDEINLRAKEIRLDPKRLKTRQPRGAPIPIHDDVLPILRQLVSEAEGDYVFPKINSHLKSNENRIDWSKPQTDLQKTFERIRTKAKIACRFHDLRHTAITNMVAARIPVTTISKVMGCSITLINKIYDHINEEIKNELRVLCKGRFALENEQLLIREMM